MSKWSKDPANKDPDKWKVSFILSAFNRPTHLICALASLAIQTRPHEIIVTDNSDDPEAKKRQNEAARDFGASWIDTHIQGARHCYESAELAAPLATGDWLAFPSDDGYYVPGYSDTMLKAAAAGRWDLVYCDLIYDPRMGGRYGVLRVEPRLRHIDKTCFMVKRDKFEGFPDRGVFGDGHLIESLVGRGLRHGKAPGVLLVHN